jgi:hypothetical protein
MLAGAEGHSSGASISGKLYVKTDKGWELTVRLILHPDDSLGPSITEEKSSPVSVAD